MLSLSGIEGNVVQLNLPGGGSPEFKLDRYPLKDFVENDDN